MNYIFHQHYNFQPTVLLADPEPEALALYARHLAIAHLLVNVCAELSQLPRQIRDIRPQLLIVNPSPDVLSTIAVLKQVLALVPALPIITVGSPIPDLYLDRLMASGVSLHINRTLSQPRDVALAARQILGLT